jgi:hypothetical protein
VAVILLVWWVLRLEVGVTAVLFFEQHRPTAYTRSAMLQK